MMIWPSMMPKISFASAVLGAFALASLGVGCENKADLSYNQYEGQSSADQSGYRKSYISVKMPDRNRLSQDSADQAKQLGAYQVTITPSLRSCGTATTETGPYQDAYWVQVEVNGNCPYRVEVRFGPGAAAKGKVTFRADIEPLFEKHCHECHIKGGLMEYFDSTKFEEVKLRTERIMTSILNDNMPWKREPLSAAEKELFKRWEANGFAEGTAAVAPRPLAPGFGDGYYQSGVLTVSPDDIRKDRFNLGLTPTFYLTTSGQSAGFKTPTFSSP